MSTIRRPILFLDVDGVLNAHRPPGVDGGLDPVCLYNITIALVETRADIVLSSAWRYMGRGRQSTFGQCLRGCGCDDILERIVDSTDLESVPESRHLAILDWVADHNPPVWVAIDDLADIRRLPAGHWLQTDGYAGFSYDNAADVIKLIHAQCRKARR